MICKKCAHESYCDTAQFCIHKPPITITSCSKFKEKSQTNGDRIRSMTDEELAEWIVRKTEGYGFDGYDASVKAWLDWLRAKAAPAIIPADDKDINVLGKEEGE